MGLAMAPATESIMGSLPLAKAGVGSAMNDTTRQIGGALGVAILGSIFASSYATHIVSSLRGSARVVDRGRADSVGAALAIGEKIGGTKEPRSPRPPRARSSTPWIGGCSWERASRCLAHSSP